MLFGKNCLTKKNKCFIYKVSLQTYGTINFIVVIRICANFP